MPWARLASAAALLLYAGIPVAAYLVVKSGARSVGLVAFDVALSAVPMILLAAVTWRLVWPTWKLVAKLLVHPCIYAVLSVYVGHWCIAAAWVHQGVLGLGGHIWFSRRHGFTWYAVEDPQRYVMLFKTMLGAVGGPPSSP